MTEMDKTASKKREMRTSAQANNLVSRRCQTGVCDGSGY